MVFKIMVNEEGFNLEILEWDDFTLGLLKSYSDWKCNGNQQITPKKETEDTVKINVNNHMNNHMNEPIEKERTKGENKHGTWACGTPLFKDKDLICKSSKYNSASIYRPVLNYILANIDIRFTKKEIAKNIFDFHKTLNRDITHGSSSAYASAYIHYMVDNDIVRERDDGFIKVHKKKLSMNNTH